MCSLLVDRFSNKHAVVECGRFLSLCHKPIVIVIIFAEFDAFALSTVFGFADPMVDTEVFFSFDMSIIRITFIFLNLNFRIYKISGKKIFVTREHFPKEGQDGLVSEDEFPSGFYRVNVFEVLCQH